MSTPKLQIKEDGLYVENPQSEAEFLAELREVLNEIGVASFNEADYIKNSKTAKDDPVLLSKNLPGRLDAKVFFFPDTETPSKVIATIIPPRSGKELSKADILLKLDEVGYEGISPDLSAIDSALERQKSEKLTYSFTVGTRTAPEIEVTLETDNIEALITVTPDEGWKSFFEEDIYFALTKARIVKGLQKDVIHDIIQKQECEEPRVVARGASPVNGDDGEILYHFDMVNENSGPEIDEHGKVDHHHLGVYSDVDEGAVLCELLPPGEGLPGYDVLGRVLPAEPGKEIDLPAGANTKPQPGKPNVLIASCAGIPKQSSGKILIDPVLNIKGDVGISTGDVEFKGPVNIAGTISGGYKVSAEGDVVVNNCCNSATIESEGDVILKYGIRSDDGALIKAGGDVHAAFLEGATVEAGGNVFVQEYIYHSNITAGKGVEVVGKKGFITGSKIIAHRRVLGKRLGSSAVPKTEIFLETSSHEKLALEEPDQIKLDQLISDLEEAVNTIEKIERRNEKRKSGKAGKKIVKENVEESEKKPEEETDEVSNDEKEPEVTEEHNSEFHKQLILKKRELLKNILSINPNYVEPGLSSSLFVAILGSVHPNVIVSIDGTSLKVNNEFIDVKFVARKDKVVMESLDTQEFEELITSK